jgi:TonB-linked SusC/RagA family outer membrane protein
MQEFATCKSSARGGLLNQLTCSLKHRKAVRIMKLTGILLLAGCLQLSARGLSQTVSLSVKDAQLLTVLKAIVKQTDFTYLVSGEQLQKAKLVTFTATNLPLMQVLDLCFKGQPLTYTIVGKVINVVPRNEKNGHDNSLHLSPPVDIKGRIVNESGEPVLATVAIKGTGRGTNTNENGEFTLAGVDENAILVITGVGIEPRELKATAVSNLNIIVKILVAPLEETVIKGYYSTTVKLNTGNVSRVSGKDIQMQPVSDPILALQGRVPGLYIQQTSGIPGANSTVRIMGQNSIAGGNDPYILVDGVPISSTTLSNPGIGGSGALGNPVNGPGQGISPFNALNPADIESIEILKDADATAIYGSRGANGVILITTKKGKAGDTKVDVNVFSGAGKVSRKLDLLNTEQYLEMRHEALKNDGITTIPANNYDINGVWDNTRYTDWQKELIGNTAHFTNAQINISGGNNNTQFYIGGGYSVQGTVYPGDFADKKASAHFGLTNASINKRFHLQFTGNYVNDNSKIPTTDFTTLILLAPDAPSLYNADGSLNWQMFNGTSTWLNPLLNVYIPSAAITKNLIGNLTMSYELLPGLQLKGSFGYTSQEMNQTRKRPATIVNAPPNNQSQFSSLNMATTSLQTWIIEPQVSYQKKMGKGQLDMLIGSSFQENVFNSLATNASNFTNDALINNPLNASTKGINGKDNWLYHYEALYGRIGYNWADKYLINLTGRRDGSSRFGPGKQFGNFGAVGVGWIFSNEKWIQKGLSFISYGKLRTSIGTTGNDQIGNYQYLSTYTSSSSTYQGLSGLYPTALANPYYGWEVVKKFQIGLDLGFIHDKVLISATYFKNRDNNQLVGYPLPSITGFTTIQYNLPAIVQNSGWEITLNTVNMKSKKFTWSSNINLTIPKNVLVSYPGIEASSFANKYVVGKSLYIQKSYRWLNVKDSTGIYQYESAGKSTYNPKSPGDLTATPEISQQYYGGFQNTFSYKGIQLDIFFQFVKQTALNISNKFFSPGQVGQNVTTFYLTRWQEIGDITNVGKFSTNNATDPNGILSSSDYVISDASFIRLKTLSLSYALPTNWQKKAHLKKTRIYVQGQNLLTITNYSGLDPETSSTVGANSVMRLPTLKMLTAGVQITL